MASSISIPAGQRMHKETPERRLIFNGGSQPRTVPQTNKQVKRRRVNPIPLILMVICAAFMAVFFIWNKIAVNHLAGDLDRMQTEYQNIVGKNEILRSEVSQKSSPERVEKIAQDQIGLTFRKEQPVLFELDPRGK